MLALPCRCFLAAFPTLLLQHLGDRMEIIVVDLKHVRTGAINSILAGQNLFETLCYCAWHMISAHAAEPKCSPAAGLVGGMQANKIRCFPGCRLLTCGLLLESLCYCINYRRQSCCRQRGKELPLNQMKTSASVSGAYSLLLPSLLCRKS